MAEARIIALRRADSCIACGATLATGTRAAWNPITRTVTCLACHGRSVPRAETAPAKAPQDELERGTPGASARRRYDALHNRREQQAKQRFGRRLGGLYLALSEEPQSTRAWGIGSTGERRLGGVLETIQDESRAIVLHDRRIPGTRANIDHIAICRTGIYVIDAKRYQGRVQRIDEGGWFSTDERLYVGRRDCSKLIPAMQRQLDATRSALTREEAARIKIFPVLCFVEAEWSLFANPFTLSGVWVAWPKALHKQLLVDGPLAPDDLQRLARQVTAALPPA